MAEAKFHSIYKELVKRIKEKEYTTMLPTENMLTEEFKTSRNTVRRAISMLNDNGFTYSIKGRGVVILESFDEDRWSFDAKKFDGIETIKEDNTVSTRTIVTDFQKVILTEEESQRMPFSAGEFLYKVERVRVLNDKNMILDLSYFKADQVPALKQDIVEESVYEYFKKNQMKIVAAKRRFLVVGATQNDYDKLELGEYNCVGVLENLVFNDMGRLFEYTESRFVPGSFDLSYFVQNDGDE